MKKDALFFYAIWVIMFAFCIVGSQRISDLSARIDRIEEVLECRDAPFWGDDD